ncbi:DUF1329 domain-containing protein [Vreelandella utahensis]|nr:DUF1329 domain-containing protein [Halomonas utahensis]
MKAPRLNITLIAAVTGGLMLGSGSLTAEVSQSEAQRLGGGEITRFGALRAGSDDGVIPAYDGGLPEPPDNVDYGESGDFHPNPFPDDEIRHTVTADNMEQYDEYLTKGTKALLQAYPDTYEINVYPSRRTMAWPEWILDNIEDNATDAELVGGGNGIDGAYGGIPFPILHGSNEEQAQQAMWNHLTSWRGIYVERRSGEVAVETDGDYSMTMSEQELFYNFYNPEGDESTLDNTLFYYLSRTTSPARLAGGAVLIHETLNQVKEPRRAWGYNAGQRRVRRAPNLAYDSPIAAADNLRTADETDLFNGALDKYNWEYRGVQQYYIPYNNYEIAQDGLEYEKILGTKHLNPDLQRWERHRVHVVEANLKDDERHIFSRRVFYIDADSWKVVSVDQYDGRGELWRVSQAMEKSYYEVPTVWTALDVFHDLQSKRYHVQGLDTEEGETLVFTDRVPNKRYFSPQALRRRGRR